MDSLDKIVAISKTDGKINNVDYTNITQLADPFNQVFNDPDVAKRISDLNNGLNNLGNEMAKGKTPGQIGQEYEQKRKDKKDGSTGCKNP